MDSKYDLEERTFQFANDCRKMMSSLQFSTAKLKMESN